MSEKVSTFRERFEELVESSGETASELAKELSVSNQTISAWRTGTRSPKKPTIITIANHFRVNAQWLSGFDEEKEIPSNATNFYIPEESISDFLNSLKEESVESLHLWIDATPSARRAAIAVLRSMREEKEENK